RIRWCRDGDLACVEPVAVDGIGDHRIAISDTKAWFNRADGVPIARGMMAMRGHSASRELLSRLPSGGYSIIFWPDILVAAAELADENHERRTVPHPDDGGEAGLAQESGALRAAECDGDCPHHHRRRRAGPRRSGNRASLLQSNNGNVAG